MNKTKYILTLALLVTAGLITIGVSAYSQQPQIKPADTEPVNVTLYKSPDCQCCSRWAAYMEENGFSVTKKLTTNLAAVKAKYEVPQNLRACHTALVDGYVVEGHAPAEMVKKLLKKRPDAKGIAVPGMPAGSPGMELGLQKTAFDVILFDGQGNQSVYGTY